MANGSRKAACRVELALQVVECSAVGVVCIVCQLHGEISFINIIQQPRRRSATGTEAGSAHPAALAHLVQQGPQDVSVLYKAAHVAATPARQVTVSRRKQFVPVHHTCITRGIRTGEY